MSDKISSKSASISTIPDAEITIASAKTRKSLRLSQLERKHQAGNEAKKIPQRPTSFMLRNLPISHSLRCKR